MPSLLAFPSGVNVWLDKVTKRFGKVTAVSSVSLEIRNGELFFLLGPSGCGKTTVLRMLAGFYHPDEGRIFFEDRNVSDVPPHQRNTGMVFQNYALWPHMSVFENVAYGLDVRRVSDDEKKKRVMEALEIVRMADLAERTPNQLSGGQQQRVALARALVIKPDILLLDEPLSNLDAKLRLEMRDEIKRIHAETKITTFYVTHDQKEALSLADRLAVMNNGSIEQIGAPRDVYRWPRNRFVAGFIGEMNFVSGVVESVEGVEWATVETAGGRVIARTTSKLESGKRVLCGFRPEAARVGSKVPNVIFGAVQNTTYLGEMEQFHIKLADGCIVKAQLANPERVFQPDELVQFSVDKSDLIVMQEED